MRTLQHIAILLVTMPIVVNCSTQASSRKPLVSVAHQEAFACMGREWHKDWASPDRCNTCVDEIARCVNSKGMTFCQTACEACLGQEFCHVKSNIEWAQTSLERSRIKPGQVHAFIRAALDGFRTDWITYEDSGYILAPGGETDRVISPQGDSWTIPAVKEGCGHVTLRENILQRPCSDHLELYDLRTGFRFQDIVLTNPIDLDTTRLEVDPSRSTYLVTDSRVARIFSADGTQIVSHDNPGPVVRVGSTWTDHAVIDPQHVVYFHADQVADTLESKFGTLRRPSVHGTFVSDSSLIFDARSRAWFSCDGYPQFSGRAVLCLNYEHDTVEQVFPVHRALTHIRTPPAQATRQRDWAYSSELGQLRMVDDVLWGTVLTETHIGVSKWVIPDVIVGSTRLHAVAQRHGNLTWSAPVVDKNAIWIASSDGLVKRWDFDSGTGQSYEIPFEFAVGGAHATADGGLVLKSVFWNPGESRFETGERVMVWHPDRPVTTHTFPGLNIRDAALATPNTLVVVGQTETIWWDIAKGELTHKENGRGHLSENGASIAFYTAATTFHRIAGPARFMRTDDFTKVYAIDAVLSCAFSPNGDLLTCGEPKKKGNEFWQRVYAVETGDRLRSAVVSGAGVFAQSSPDGDANLIGDESPYRYIWSPAKADVKRLDSDDFYLGFSYDDRLITVRGEYITLETY